MFNDDAHYYCCAKFLLLKLGWRNLHFQAIQMCMCVYMFVWVGGYCVQTDANYKWFKSKIYAANKLYRNNPGRESNSDMEAMGNVERVKKRRRDLKPSSFSPSSSVWWADTLSHPCGSSWRAFLTTLPSEDWEQATVTSCHQQQSFWPSTRVQHKLAKASLEPRKQWVKIIWRLKIALAIYCRFPLCADTLATEVPAVLC